MLRIQAEALTYDDVSLVPAHSNVLPKDVSLATNLTLQSSVVLAGEGVGLYDLVADRVRAVVDAERDAQAEPVQIHVDRAGFGAWARGAAVVAIQTAITRLPA